MRRWGLIVVSAFRWFIGLFMPSRSEQIQSSRVGFPILKTIRYFGGVLFGVDDEIESSRDRNRLLEEQTTSGARVNDQARVVSRPMAHLIRHETVTSLTPAFPASDASVSKLNSPTLRRIYCATCAAKLESLHRTTSSCSSNVGRRFRGYHEIYTPRMLERFSCLNETESFHTINTGK